MVINDAILSPTLLSTAAISNWETRTLYMRLMYLSQPLTGHIIGSNNNFSPGKPEWVQFYWNIKLWTGLKDKTDLTEIGTCARIRQYLLSRSLQFEKIEVFCFSLLRFSCVCFLFVCFLFSGPGVVWGKTVSRSPHTDQQRLTDNECSKVKRTLTSPDFDLLNYQFQAPVWKVVNWIAAQ